VKIRCSAHSPESRKRCSQADVCLTLSRPVVQGVLTEHRVFDQCVMAQQMLAAMATSKESAMTSMFAIPRIAMILNEVPTVFKALIWSAASWPERWPRCQWLSFKEVVISLRRKAAAMKELRFTQRSLKKGLKRPAGLDHWLMENAMAKPRQCKCAARTDYSASLPGLVSLAIDVGADGQKVQWKNAPAAPMPRKSFLASKLLVGKSTWNASCRKQHCARPVSRTGCETMMELAE